MTEQELNIYRFIDVGVRGSQIAISDSQYLRNDYSLEQLGRFKLQSHLHRYMDWLDSVEEVERFALYQGAPHCLLMSGYYNNNYQLIVEEGHPLLSVSLAGQGYWLDRGDFPLLNTILDGVEDSPALLCNWWTLVGQSRPEGLTLDMLKKQYYHYFRGYRAPDLGLV